MYIFLVFFNSEKKRFFQKEIDTIKEKLAIFIQNQKEFKKIKACVIYQQSVQLLLSSDSNEYIISYELLSNFKQKFDELKMKIDYFKKEIEKIVYEYIIQELYPDTFNNLPRLIYLHLNDNQIIDLHPNIFNNLPSLIELHLYNNPIEESHLDTYNIIIHNLPGILNMPR